MRSRVAEVSRQLEFLLRVLTPRTVFMEIGSPDCELALRAASYVERVWSVNAAVRVQRAPCNLRWDLIDGMPVRCIDVAFSERMYNASDVRPLLKRGAVWFIYGKLAPAAALLGAGFARVEYYAGKLRLPQALARIWRGPVTAAYK